MNQFKRLLSFLLTCALLAGLWPGSAWATGDAFSGGTGTSDDPYQISTAQELADLATAVNAGDDKSGKYYKLTKNIDLSAACGAGIGEGGADVSWTPIGKFTTSVSGHERLEEDNSFKGTFDGNGHTISGLYINASDGNRQGLFGYLGEGGTIKNLGVSGTITARQFVGGVCGVNEKGTITNCYHTGAVTGQYDVGGVCGWNNGGMISNCYNTGAVVCTDSSGGGGVCGCNNYGGAIEKCYNTASVTGAFAPEGVCGDNMSNGTLTNCCYNSDVATDGNADVTGLTTADFAKESTFTAMGWDFTNTWQMDEVLGRPVLKTVLEKTYFSGAGTADAPYLIPNLAALERFRQYVNAGNDCAGIYFKVTADIDISGEWTPIGDWNSRPFKGTFDGGGHKISGFTINGGNQSYLGLFAYLDEGGTIKNLGVNGTVSGSAFIGGLCGRNYNGTITNCYNEGNVTGNEFVGGLCGDNSFGTVANCYNVGTIKGIPCEYPMEEPLPITEPKFIGGVCGDSAYAGAAVTNCYYLDTCGAAGEGESKTAAAFASGEVARLLQGEQMPQVWGQTVGSAAPELTADAGKRMYKVTFTVDHTEYAVRYGNPAGLLSDLPAEPAKEGYTFTQWAATEGGTAFTATTPVTGDVTLTAWFQSQEPSTPPVTPAPSDDEDDDDPDYYTLTATAGEGGSIDPGGRVRAREGRGKTFSIVPDEGYEIADVLVDGESVGAVTEYTFPRVFDGHTIQAIFRKIIPADDPTEGGEPSEGDRPAWNPFEDVAEGDWFYDSVRDAYQRGLMVGTSETRFSPGGDASRVTIATILWRLDGEKVVNLILPYPDVPQGAWYTEAVRWATAAGMGKGYGDGTFGPEDPITREDLAVLLWRYAGEPETAGTLDGFTDKEEVSGYARTALRWAVERGILEGRDGGVLDPKGKAARAEAAAMLQRYLKNLD